MDYSSEIDKINEIVMRFDECLTVKCEKSSLTKFQDYSDKSFVLKKSYTEFTKNQLDQMSKFSQLYSEQ